MSNLAKILSILRPNLSAGSIKTYCSILNNLHSKIYGKETPSNLEDFKNTEIIINFLKDLPFNKRKTTYAALFVLTELPIYQTLMFEDIKTYDAEINKQILTPAQEESWVTTDTVNSHIEELKKEADILYRKKQDIDEKDIQNIQSYIIMCLLSGVYIAPRRAQDFTDFKIVDINKETDNYIEGSNLVFNSYKTSGSYGKQIIPIPEILHKILKKWIKINPTNYLLFDSNFNPMTNVKLTQRINKIFDGQKVSVNQLRHTYLQNKFGEHIGLHKKINDTMVEMGSSPAMLKNYVKYI